jgi:hypothetical protein
MITQWTGTEYKNMEKVFLGVIAGAAQPELIRAARGILDFIYYAHFEQHSLASLTDLEAALRMFHDNKHIFIEEGIREDFNIPKLHATLHYLLSIRSRGTADGFNSEGTERLHIDYNKVLYKKTSKKAYIKQMTMWLGRQEKVHRFTAYLQWAVPGYQPKPIQDTGDQTSAATNLISTVIGDVTVDQPETHEIPNKPCTAYHLPKQPSYPNTSLNLLITDFGAVDFWPCLETFLRRSKVPMPDIVHPCFPIYKCLDVWIPPAPQVTKYEIKDTIFATCSKKAEPFKEATAGQFSTIFAQKSDALVSKNLEGIYLHAC